MKMNWELSKGLEREIIVNLGSKTKATSEIARELGSPLSSISMTIERMIKQNLAIKNIDYKIDARKSLITIQRKNIKIKRTHDFYARYFMAVIFTLVSSWIIAFLTKNEHYYLFGLGAMFGIVIPSVYMLYKVYVTKDKVIVEKRVNSKKKIQPKETSQSE